jgi:hypothetical protein
LVNVRIRGKIPHEEWPRIAERFRIGETLAEIARSYHCTAPAIRYIVARTPARAAKAKSDKNKQGVLAVPPATDRARRSSRFRPGEERGPPARTSGAATNSIWSRMNSDIASFLAAINALSSEDSDENYEALLMATDRLLWASARTRLEVEELLRKRKERTPARRLSV